MSAHFETKTAAEVLDEYRGNMPRSVAELDAKLRPIWPALHSGEGEQERVIDRMVADYSDSNKAIAEHMKARARLTLLAAVVAELDARLTAVETYILED